MTEHEHQDIVDRLRAVGRRPVPPAVATAHIESLGVGGARSRSTHRTWRVAAAAAVAVVVLATGAAAALVATPDGRSQGVTAAAPPGETVDVTLADDPCTGPPPFAGDEPVSDEARQAEADAHSALREDCPADDQEPADDETQTGETQTDATVVDPHPDDPCKGPPPFAGQVPSSGEARAEEAAEHAAIRHDCPDDDGAAADDQPEQEPAGQQQDVVADSGTDPVERGRPEGTPGPQHDDPTDDADEPAAGPPAGAGGGPPAGVPSGPPEGTPGGGPGAPGT